MNKLALRIEGCGGCQGPISDLLSHLMQVTSPLCFFVSPSVRYCSLCQDIFNMNKIMCAVLSAVASLKSIYSALGVVLHKEL